MMAVHRTYVFTRFYTRDPQGRISRCSIAAADPSRRAELAHRD